MLLKPNPSIKLEIIYENKDIIVIDKPAGQLVHPIKQNQNDTLVNGLLAHEPTLKNVGEDPLRPGIVHRLDKETSGLIIAAKNNRSFEHLKKQFQERKVEKHYLALVIGKVKDKKGIITKAISRSKKDGLKRSALLDEKSKSAWTEYRIIRHFKDYPSTRFARSGNKLYGELVEPLLPERVAKSDESKACDYTLLDVFPKTGRTHQIRVHLASIGHPIAGDKQYRFKRQPILQGLNRQFLHAYYLKFKLPDDKIVEFKSPLPKDLKEILKQLQTKFGAASRFSNDE